MGQHASRNASGRDHLVDELAQQAVSNQLASRGDLAVQRVQARQQRISQAGQLPLERQAGQGRQVDTRTLGGLLLRRRV